MYPTSHAGNKSGGSDDQIVQKLPYQLSGLQAARRVPRRKNTRQKRVYTPGRKYLIRLTSKCLHWIFFISFLFWVANQ